MRFLFLALSLLVSAPASASSLFPSHGFEFIELNVHYVGKYNVDRSCPSSFHPKGKPKCCPFDFSLRNLAPDIRIDVYAPVSDLTDTRALTPLKEIECPRNQYTCAAVLGIKDLGRPYRLRFYDDDAAADDDMGSGTLSFRDDGTPRIRLGPLAKLRLRAAARPISTRAGVSAPAHKPRNNFDACYEQVAKLPLDKVVGEHFEAAPLEAVMNMLSAYKSRRPKRVASVDDPNDMVEIMCGFWAATVRPQPGRTLPGTCPCCE